MDSEGRDRQIERKQRQRWVAEIEREYASLKAQEAKTVLHNKVLHESILADWKTNSPKMWASLKKEGSYFPDKLAYVLQERMWAQCDSMVKSGMNMTDARRIAEEDNLMLEPEDEVLTEDRLDPWTPPLPKDVLEGSAQRNNEKILPEATAEHLMPTERRTQRELELLEAVADVRPDVRRRIQKDTVLEIVAVIALLMVLKLVFG